MKIYRAGYDSRHFTFEAYCISKHGAELALLDALNEHGRRCSLEPGWWCDEDYQKHVEAETLDKVFDVREFEIGVGYRDRETELATVEGLGIRKRAVWNQYLEDQSPETLSKYKLLEGLLKARTK